MDTLTILIPSIHEHGVSFHLFVSSPVSLVSSAYRYFTFLVKLICQYFIVFDASVNGIIFLVSFFQWFTVSV